MIYTYYNKEIKKGYAATGIAALARVSKLKATDLYKLFSNGDDYKETENYIIIRTQELIKGNQRVAGQSSKSNSDPFDKLMKS